MPDPFALADTAYSAASGAAMAVALSMGQRAFHIGRRPGNGDIACLAITVACVTGATTLGRAIDRPLPVMIAGMAVAFAASILIRRRWP